MARIGRIEGRTQAIVHCANGTWLPGTFFAHFFKDHDDVIRQFQVYQEREGAFTLRVVPGDAYSEEDVQRMLDHLEEYVGPGTAVEIEVTDEIPLIRTGKRSPVVSLVHQDFQAIRAEHGRV